MIKRIGHLYVSFENFITNLLIVAIVFFVFTSAIMRWVGMPLSWSVEFAQMLFVWAIFLGSNRTLRENKHIEVDFFVKMMPAKVKAIIDIVMNVLVLAFLLFLTKYGIQLSIENSERQISNLPLSYSFITMAVPIGSILMIFTTVIKLKGKAVKFMSPSHEVNS